MVQPHRSNHREAGVAALPRGRVDVRQHPIPKLEVLAADRLDVRIVQLARVRVRGAIGVAAKLHRSELAGVPAPRQPQVPVAAVRAEQRAERAELEPAHVQLARVLRGRDEAADVGAPERDAREAGVDGDRHVRAQRLPRRDTRRRTRETRRIAACPRSRCDAAQRAARSGARRCEPSQYMRMRASRDGASRPSP